MFDSGDIEAYYSHPDSGSTATFFCPSGRQLDAAVSGRDKKLRYRLTLQGASRWEALANPNWARYFTDCGWTGTHVEITAGSRERLHELIDNSETLWDVVMPRSGIIVEVFRPWTIAHWKVLPEGFRAEVPYTETPLSMEDFLKSHAALRRSSELHRREYYRLRHWADSICGYHDV